ncbi:hypothetical protein PDESU_06039 [Pontiella desulfatans]|uniref:Uncharacterized protein n=1 Tax=Pontiella desulfatans TaxID=2750659 RepID=A0A6C2UC39_PONDE|nr:hypothetical protein PDESU_06039 [Pontiella desulfatans]
MWGRLSCLPDADWKVRATFCGGAALDCGDGVTALCGWESADGASPSKFNSPSRIPAVLPRRGAAHPDP